MKKFLSLVLSLVMAMSLVTVGASAKDDEGFTDASDINYKEAVDVMSGIGIISGYRDDSFRPDGALTRGAAAKIIAYLNLGTKTADVLSCTSAPYTDVKPTDTFAPYIAYVKNAKICDGYSDGSFRAGAPLTGFAFTKMLLTSLGYSSEVEEFTGANWSVAVAKRAVKIGLTDGNDDFTGMSTCTREEACLYALNTLQANEVEYDNEGSIVTAGDVKIVNKASKAEDVTIGSSDKRYKNIDDEKSDGDQIVQFAEDHFKDLELDEDKKDDFGAPANKWTYKDKEIGTYATEADFEFTTTADGDTNEEKLEDMGLDEYDMWDNVTYYVNGDSKDDFENNTDKELQDLDKDSELGGMLVKLLGKGRLVKVYTDDQTIEHIAVIDTYLAEIDSISSASDRVTLKTKEENSQTFRVDDDNDCYAELADMDEEDLVLVTVADDEVQSVAIPETESGTISRISKNSDKKCDGLTFDGTKYDLSYTANNKKDGDAFSTSMELKADYDSTLYIDTYGYAIWIDDVEADSDYIVALETYSSVEDGKIVTLVEGYDMEGNEVSLNIGTNENKAVDTYKSGKLDGHGDSAIIEGTVYKYSTEDAANHGDYLLTEDSDRIFSNDEDGFKASAVKYDGNYFDDDVKFLFIEGGDDMDDVTVETECQKVEIPDEDVPSKFIQYVLDEDKDEIIAIIVKGESDNATGDDVAYVDSIDADADIDGDDATEYTLYIEGEEVEEVVSKDDVRADTFVTYAKNDDGTYELDKYDVDDHSDDDTAVILKAIVKDVPTEKVLKLVEKSGDDYFDAEDLEDLNCKNAVVVDLTDEDDIGNMSDLKDAFDDDAEEDSIVVSVVFNNKNNDDDEHEVSYIFINNVDYKDTDDEDDEDTSDIDATYIVDADYSIAAFDKLSVTDEDEKESKLKIADFDTFKFANSVEITDRDVFTAWADAQTSDFVIDVDSRHDTIEVQKDFVSEVASIKAIDDTVDVVNGTTKEDAIKKLATEATITDNFGTTYKVALTWTIESYDGTTADSYTATGKIKTLPEGVEYADGKGVKDYTVTSTVKVAAKKLSSDATVSVDDDSVVIATANATDDSVTASINNAGTLSADATVEKGESSTGTVTASVDVSTGKVTIVTDASWVAGDTATVTINGLAEDGSTAAKSATITVTQA